MPKRPAQTVKFGNGRTGRLNDLGVLIGTPTDADQDLVSWDTIIKVLDVLRNGGDEFKGQFEEAWVAANAIGYRYTNDYFEDTLVGKKKK